MSLNSALQAGVAGLTANSAALSAIGNDIANVNTVGYKGNDVNFQSIVASSSNGGVAAGGVTATDQQLVTQLGTTIQTQSSTDLSISGQGMFVTTTSPTSAATASQVLYTRAGSFTPDANGFLKNSAGLYLQGVLADSTGAIPTSGLNIGILQPINVTNVGGAVSPTTVAGLTGTLNSEQPISAQAATYNASVAANSMTAYDPTTGTGVKPDFTMQVPISDSQGGQHTIQVDLLKSSTPDQWYAEIQAVPTSDVTGGTIPGQISSGVLTFNPDGSLNLAASTLNTSLSFGASAAGPPTAPAVNWAASLGVAAQSVNLSLGGAGGTSGLTQVAGASAVTSTTANGTPFGSLASIAIAANGIVTATFTNGVSRAIAEVPLATFPNADGLTSVSGTAYEASNNSGLVSLQAAGSGGSGQLASFNLEASTIDLSSEFTDLITTQQAYSASSKVITTADQMSQVLLQLIQ
ncbi:MAG TPA: flagellar hook protein FlgE [Caulobacteraceae bacterium]|nr:flagellar hook protein FlgE [Caulobacteraceae bacterium]